MFAFSCFSKKFKPIFSFDSCIDFYFLIENASSNTLKLKLLPKVVAQSKQGEQTLALDLFVFPCAEPEEQPCVELIGDQTADNQWELDSPPSLTQTADYCHESRRSQMATNGLPAVNNCRKHPKSELCH